MLFRKMTESIEVCHNANIMHRDVKMENFLVNVNEKDDLVIKLSDFGFACKFEKTGAHHETNTEFKFGSMYGMAPETLKDNEYSQKVDVWALGVILFEFLTN